MGGRRGIRKQLLDDLKEKRGNYKLKREALKTALFRVITQRVITLKNAVLSCFVGENLSHARKHHIALCEGLALEEATVLSHGRLREGMNE
jgi:hypothetical protein